VAPYRSVIEVVGFHTEERLTTRPPAMYRPKIKVLAIKAISTPPDCPALRSTRQFLYKRYARWSSSSVVMRQTAAEKRDIALALDHRWSEHEANIDKDTHNESKWTEQ
jgi:hypothetical protein